ncbi:LacI family DNA-binding transcriptional regulator [Marmoricola sp. URHA0025 HA25]
MTGTGSNWGATALPTIRDVARLAGVSKTTASDALQDRGRVSTATRTRVENAAKALGYRAHAGARDLIRRRSEILGLLVGDLFDPFVSELTGHLEHYASANGFKVLLATAGPDLRDSERALTNLTEHRVAALILVAYGDDEEVVRETVGHTTPVVSLASSGPGLCIGVDDVMGSIMAVDHLLKLGHTRIAYLSGALLPPAVDNARFTGYKAALRGANIGQEAALRCTTGKRSDERRLEPIRTMLTAPDRPTAVFATSDVLALELMGCASELGLQVPRDLSIVGFDDIQMAGLPMIALTTVMQPAAELAEMSVRAVLEQLAGEITATPRLLEPDLIVRRSTAPPADRVD